MEGEDAGWWEAGEGGVFREDMAYGISTASSTSMLKESPLFSWTKAFSRLCGDRPRYAINCWIGDKCSRGALQYAAGSSWLGLYIKMSIAFNLLFLKSDVCVLSTQCQATMLAVRISWQFILSATGNTYYSETLDYRIHDPLPSFRCWDRLLFFFQFLFILLLHRRKLAIATANEVANEVLKKI